MDLLIHLPANDHHKNKWRLTEDLYLQAGIESQDAWYRLKAAGRTSKCIYQDKQHICIPVGTELTWEIIFSQTTCHITMKITDCPDIDLMMSPATNKKTILRIYPKLTKELHLAMEKI